MRVTIDFHDEPGFGTKEIGDEWAEPYLATEFGTVQLAGAEA